MLFFCVCLLRLRQLRSDLKIEKHILRLIFLSNSDYWWIVQKNPRKSFTFSKKTSTNTITIICVMHEAYSYFEDLLRCFWNTDHEIYVLILCIIWASFPADCGCRRENKIYVLRAWRNIGIPPCCGLMSAWLRADYIIQYCISL